MQRLEAVLLDGIIVPWPMGLVVINVNLCSHTACTEHAPRGKLMVMSGLPVCVHQFRACSVFGYGQFAWRVNWCRCVLYKVAVNVADGQKVENNEK